ncbi:MAG: DUF5615 family PIN-like protein [Patescibacteria group bacterium]|nr:DUF5615 family PIN-like protein [Patescibacteria group bacterium]
MPSFLADENLTKPAVKGLNKAGLDTIHIKFDLDKGGIDDPIVLNEGRKRGLTILTNNNKHFKKLPKTELKVSPGVWCLNTDIVEEQVIRAERIKKVGGFHTKKSRKGTLITATNTGFTLENCKTQKKIKFSFNDYVTSK